MLYQTTRDFQAKGMSFGCGDEFEVLGTSRRGVDVRAATTKVDSMYIGYAEDTYLTLTPKRAAKLVPVSY